MPPKVKITKEDILSASIDIVRTQGDTALNARTLAAALGCSTQPIFSNFATMEALRLAVVAEADALCNAYIDREVKSGAYPAYKASGMAYIRFAREESALFKLLYMRDRSNESIDHAPDLSGQMESIIEDAIGMDKDTAMRFHFEMWAFVHGIATMLATGFLDLDSTIISQMLTDAYLGLKKQYETEE